MTTLIEVRNSNGLVGRRDAKCYDATGPECDCICGGRNRGAGREQAIDNTRQLYEEWIEEYAQRQGLEEYDGLVSMDVLQMGLFEGVAYA